MKKYLFLAPAALLALASCTQEAFEGPAVNGNGNTTFTINLPKEKATRDSDFGDATTATYLYVQVYDNSNGNFIFDYSGEANFADGQTSTQVNLELITNKQYQILFFAASPTALGLTASGQEDTDASAVYTLSQAGELSVNYGNMNSANLLSDDYDCFAYVWTGSTASPSTDFDVTLERPVAQINWGTTTTSLNSELAVHEFGTAGQYLQSTLTMSGAGVLSSYNFITSEGTSISEPVTLEWFARPTMTYPYQPTTSDDSTSTDPSEGSTAEPTPYYSYVATQFVLANPTSGVANLTLSINNQAGTNPPSDAVNFPINVSDAPLQANYQTNIYGNLLSANAEFSVTKSDTWNMTNGVQGEPNAFEYGTEVEPGLFLDAGNQTYTITSPAGLASFAAIANDAYSGSGSIGSLSGYTIKLGADLNMSSVSNWTPFNISDCTFDGQNHTISNLTVSQTGHNRAGLFAYPNKATIQNIVFENANITGQWSSGVLAGATIFSTITNITVNNSTVTTTPYESNGNYTEGINAGAIVGILDAETSTSLTGCTVSGCTIKAYANVGGLTGLAMGYTTAETSTIENNTIENTDIYVIQNVSPYSDSNYIATDQFVGEVYGATRNVTLTAQNNTYSDNVNIIKLIMNSEGEYVVSSIEELQGVFSLGQKAMAGKTIAFSEDNMILDLEGATIQPLINDTYSTDFSATFDGKGATIKNFVVDVSGLAEDGPAGLFKAFAGTFQNLNIEGMTLVTDGDYSGFGLIGYSGGGTFKNITVTGSTITNAQGSNTSAIVGMNYGVNIEGCTVDDCTITGDRKVGGMVGASPSGTINVTGCTITDSDITATGSGNEGTAGIFVGINNPSSATINYSGNTVTGCTVNGVDAENPTSTN